MAQMRNNVDLKATSAGAAEPPSNFVDPRAFGLSKPAYSVNETLGLLPLGPVDIHLSQITAPTRNSIEANESTVFS